MGKQRDWGTSQAWLKGIFSDSRNIELPAHLVHKAREVFVTSNYSGSGLMTRGEFVEAMRRLEVEKLMSVNFASFCALAFGIYSTDDIFLTFREFALLLNDIVGKYPSLMPHSS